jgi:uncharacterized membrane protein
LSLGCSLVASIPINGTGTLISNVSQQIVSITNMAFGTSFSGVPGFFILIVILGFVSALLGQIGITTQMASAATRSMQETYWGWRAMNQIGREMTREKK